MRFLTQRYRQLRRTPDLHPFDRAHGTDTTGLIPADRLQTAHPSSAHTAAYYPMSPSRFRSAIHLWRRSSPAHPIEQTTFLDLGCGKGRALLLASEHPFRQAIGIELHPRLVEIAEANLRLWQAADRARCPASVLQADAADLELPPGPCLLYLFHPFTEPVTRRLIQNLRSQRPAALDLIYFNPETAGLWLIQPEIHLLWSQVIPMSPEDAAADTLANPDDLCHAYRWTPVPSEPAEVQPNVSPPS